MRNKERSDAITSGQYGPKLPGLGRAPTSSVRAFVATEALLAI